MIILCVLLGICIGVIIVAMATIYNVPFNKSYRKSKGGTWHLISFTYKKDMGMTKVTVTEWITHEELNLWEMRDDFKVLKTEQYEC